MSGDVQPFGFTVRQRSPEKIAYSVTTTRWGSNPENATAVLYDVTDDGAVDVSADCLAGSVAVDGDVIALPLIKDLVKDHLYWLECEFDVPRGELTPQHMAFYLQIQCVR
jgi:hypothetical protein